ncbi:MAG: hypothetical protein Q7S57_04190 [bacterium]|nr:hypothetical protein [bacterium]
MPYPITEMQTNILLKTGRENGIARGLKAIDGLVFFFLFSA